MPRSRSLCAAGLKLSEVGNLLDLIATRIEDSEATVGKGGVDQDKDGRIYRRI